MEKRELLTKILELLREKHDAEAELDKFLKNSPLFFEAHLTPAFKYDTVLGQSFVFLAKGKNDEKLDDIIFWWMYEMDFGRRFEIGDLIDDELPEGENTPDLTSIEGFVEYAMKG